MKCIDYTIKVFKNYSDFEGRASKSEYWYFFLFNIIACFLLSIIDSLLGFNFFASVYSLAAFIPGLSVSFRRLHDTGKSAWWLLVCLIPIIGWIVLLFFMTKDSEIGDNQYGPIPKKI